MIIKKKRKGNKNKINITDKKKKFFLIINKMDISNSSYSEARMKMVEEGMNEYIGF